MKIYPPTHVMTVHRRIMDRDRIVYLLTVPKPIRYRSGRTRIVYIGTTRRGVSRIAASVAARATDAFDGDGRHRVEVYVLACTPTPGLDSWRLLERALISEFRARHHDLPACNAQGKSFRWNDQLQRYFRRDRIRKLLESFAR